MDVQVLSPYRANLAPIDFETQIESLPVHGVMPAGLHGAVFRNGPNPLHVDPARHWFAGHGMVHRLAIADGRVSYANRWVRTQRWLNERAGGAANIASNGDGLSRTTPRQEPEDGVANTNVLAHAGRLLALEELHLPIELDGRTLGTKGAWNAEGALSGAFTAHPKLDPRTGELLFFSYGGADGLGAQMTAGSLDRHGRLASLTQFKAPYASMVHDFAATPDYLLFPVFPLTASAARTQAGLPAYAWEPSFGAYVGVLRREDARKTKADVRWFRAPTCFVFHVMNAWEENGLVHIDVMQSDTPSGFTWPDGQPIERTSGTRLCRWTIDPARSDARVASEALSDLTGEFPRIDDRMMGLRYRHGWFAAHGDDNDTLFSRIAHIDHAHPSRADVYALPDDDATSEPVFVPRSAGAQEGDGWILAIVYRGQSERSDLLVFDAMQLSAGPIAIAELPHRIPNGFHGNWIDAHNRPIIRAPQPSSTQEF
jgi:carotenoid cleavage dioxygenase-like enzyme